MRSDPGGTDTSHSKGSFDEADDDKDMVILDNIDHPLLKSVDTKDDNDMIEHEKDPLEVEIYPKRFVLLSWTSV